MPNFLEFHQILSISCWVHTRTFFTNLPPPLRMNRQF